MTSSSGGGHGLAQGHGQRDRERERDHLGAINTSTTGSSTTAASSSGTPGVAHPGGGSTTTTAGGFFSKLIGRAGSTTRTSSSDSTHPHPFHRTRSDLSTTSSSHHKSSIGGGGGGGGGGTGGGGHASGSSYSGSPATSPVLSPTTVGGSALGAGGSGAAAARDRSRKSGLGSAEVIRGDYEGIVGRKVSAGHHVESVREESADGLYPTNEEMMGPDASSSSLFTSDRDLPWDELVGIVRGESSRMASVPGDDEGGLLAGIDRVEAVRMITRQLNRARERKRMEDELKSSVREDQGRREGHDEESSSKQQAARDDQGGGTGLPKVLGTRDKLLDLVLPLCTNESESRVRSAGFDLLASTLRISTATSTSASPGEPASIAHSPWVLAGTILNLPIDLPRNISFRYHLTDEIPSSQTLDLYGRTACLVGLTDQGKDISVDLDMIKVLIRWLNLMAAEWVRACSRGSAAVGVGKAAVDSGVGSVLGLAGTGESLDLGRRGSRAGVQRDEVRRVAVNCNRGSWNDI